MSALGCDPDIAATFLRALAHPMRLRILCRLLDGECAVAGFENELGMKQPNLSQQLAALREAGLVATRRESKSIIYRLEDARVGTLLAALRTALSGTSSGAQAAPMPAGAGTTQAQPQPSPAPGGEAGIFALAGWELPLRAGIRT